MTDYQPLSEIMAGSTTRETEPEDTMSRNKTGKRTVTAEEKRRQALDLRRMGCTYQEIADQVGVSRGYACKLVTQALTRIQHETNEIAENVRTLELTRLDNLFRHAYQAVLEGEISAIDKCVRIMDRRAKLLGLDAPNKTEISGSLTASAEWIELRGVLIKVLGEYPDAKQAVLAAITEKTKEN